MVTKNYFGIYIFILFLSLIVALNIRLIIHRWLGYIIFLIYVRGILIIFIYFSAIQPNQRLNLKRVVTSIFFFFFFTPIYLLPIIVDSFLRESEDLNHIRFLFDPLIFPILFILGVYLFVALVVVYLTI